MELVGRDPDVHAVELEGLHQLVKKELVEPLEAYRKSAAKEELLAKLKALDVEIEALLEVAEADA